MVTKGTRICECIRVASFEWGTQFVFVLSNPYFQLRSDCFRNAVCACCGNASHVSATDTVTTDANYSIAAELSNFCYPKLGNCDVYR